MAKSSAINVPSCIAYLVLFVLAILDVLFLLRCFEILIIENWLPMSYVVYVDYVLSASPFLLVTGMIIMLLIDKMMLLKQIKELKAQQCLVQVKVF